MKRRIALIILMILALTLALTACGNTVSTDVTARWKEKAETHVFNISLADFTANTNAFNTYNENGAVDSNGTYSKDFAFSAEFYSWDEIKPVSVSGTFQIDIISSGDGTAYCDVETSQEMCVEYKLTDIAENSAILDAQNGAIATQEQLDKYNLERHGDTVILWTTTTTKVKFENVPSQKPLSSYTEVNGFYVGKVEQTLTRYQIETTYDYSNKRPIANIKMNVAGEEKTVEYKFRKNSAGTFIDSNQILLYLRSLDKSSTSFQDTPSKSVFNPFTQRLATASFGLTYENSSTSLLRNTILTDTSRGNLTLATRLNVVYAAVGGSPLLMQTNLPNTLADKGLDRYFVQKVSVSKFTTVRFRSGYFAYEIDYDNELNTTDWSEIWTALSTPATPDPDEE